ILLAGTGAREGTLGGLAVEVTGDRCTLVSDGRLAGSVIAVDTAVRNLLGAGVELPRAVAAASRQPLSLIGVTDRGRIAPGQRADIVELDEACRIAAVMVGGRWVVPAAAPLRT
ncbi:MAG TPA: amidohydrolase family protein, partial [Candidatus Limnocylindrales bacterium]